MPRKTINDIISLMHENATNRNLAMAAYGMGFCTCEEMQAEMIRLDEILQVLVAEKERENRNDPDRNEVEFDYFGLFCDNPWSDFSNRIS